MEIIDAEKIVPDIKKIGILGNPFSGKTTLAATAPRPILFLSHDGTTESRVAGQKDIFIVPCYDRPGELPGSGTRRMEEAVKELLCQKEPKYKTVVSDPHNYYHARKVKHFIELNKDDTRGAYGLVKNHGLDLVEKLLMFNGYRIFIFHVRLKEDETKGTEAYLPDMDGALKDSLTGKFDAVLFTETVGVAPAVKHKVRFHSDSKHTCGIKVPIGKEELLKKELPFDIQEIVKLLQ